QKLKVLEETDRLPAGELGAYLRRKGLYWSNLSRWRKERDDGVLAAMSVDDRGRWPDQVHTPWPANVWAQTNQGPPVRDGPGCRLGAVARSERDVASQSGEVTDPTPSGLLRLVTQVVRRVGVELRPPGQPRGQVRPVKGASQQLVGEAEDGVEVPDLELRVVEATGRKLQHVGWQRARQGQDGPLPQDSQELHGRGQGAGTAGQFQVERTRLSSVGDRLEKAAPHSSRTGVEAQVVVVHVDHHLSAQPRREH